MESDLAQTRMKLEEALEWVKVVHQAVMVDLPHVVEVSFTFILDSLVFCWLSQHACFSFFRVWRRC